MPRGQKLIYLASCLLLVPALACGGGKKSSSSASSNSVQSGDTPQAGGGTAVLSEFASFAAAIAKVKTFKATLTTSAGTAPQTEATMEVQMPDRFHITSPTLELISIGADSYVKSGANWVKAPGGGGGTLGQIAQLSALATAIPASQITKGGADTVNGTKCQLYNQTTGTGTTEYCLASNNLPIRVVIASGRSKNTIIFSDYDKAVDIKAPI